MRRTTLLLVVLVAAVGFAAAGCGGEDEASPTPDTVIGTTDTTETTETTETDTTETDTGTTDETETGTTDETETGTGTDTGSTGQGDPVAGKEVFLGTAGCGSCHTLADAGTSGSIGPNLDDAQPSVELVVDRVTNGQGAMPPFEGTLSAQEIADVAAYVSQTAGS
ncbi:MAG: c-type cytochrome [Actinobacteria bacterium]|nr:c-type cytochrome [Actinomycetota bacterium]